MLAAPPGDTIDGSSYGKSLEEKEMISVEIPVDIDRPVEEVYAYLSDVARIPEWNSMVDEVVPSDTPLRVGSTAHIKMRLLGRRIEATLEIIELEPNRRVVVKTGAPISVTDTYTFEALGVGRSRLTYLTVGETKGFFKLADPIVGRVVKKQLTAQLETFKELLEARAAEPATK
jgi:uncharacterized membrane protein